MLPKDLKQIDDLISDKEGETLDFQRKAEIIANNWNISVERAKLLIRATATISNLSGFFAGAKSPVVSKNHKPESVSSANGGKLNTAEPVVNKNHNSETVINKASKPESVASASGNKPNKVVPVANKPAENSKPEIHSDLNIGKNRKDFNSELNHEISTREKDYVINQQASKRVDSVTAPINFSHVVDGEVVKRNAVGGHSHLGTNIQILEESAPLKNGVYEAKISVLNPRTGRYVVKERLSTMFPKSWTADRIKVEVDVAYKNRRHFTNQQGREMWEGTTPSGVKVEGFLEPRVTVYPKPIE